MYRIVLHNFIVFLFFFLVLTGEVLIRDIVYSSNQIAYLKFIGSKHTGVVLNSINQTITRDVIVLGRFRGRHHWKSL
jgi:hypothetical protein